MAANKTKVILFFLLISHVSKAQNIFPSFSDDPTWNVLECFWSDCVTQNYHYDYDTMLCGTSYSKISFTVGENGFFRSDSIKVYFGKTTNCADKEYLIYDFSLNVSDTVYVGYDLFLNTGKDTAQFVLGSIDTMNYFGINRKRFKMFYDPLNMGGPFFRQMNWIQNIGSDTHPFYPFKCLWDGCEESYSLLCYDSSGTQLFQNGNLNTCDTTITGINENTIESELKIFPNPFQNKINFEVDNNLIFEIEIFAYSGEQLGNFKIDGKNKFTLVLGENLSQGIYLMKMQTDKGNIFKRMVKR